ncbi:hypothetical protein [Rhodococcus rhodochrous]|uniref:hypothetical protein n=1 Tax=Rhodococcus rhodochrous TaxID=1829 RepID=UPI0017817D47|nr:hypothetical protein [Rhodococcus rhodochrous]
MAKQFTDQPLLPTADAGDVLPIRDVSAGVDKRTTVAGLAPGVAENIPAGAITPAMRGDGYKIGTIASSTVSTTGNKSITGVGFKPKLVRLGVLESNMTGFPALTDGGFTADAQYCRGWVADPGAGQWYRWSSTSYCLQRYNATGGTPMLQIAKVSMDNDGFTINVSNASNLALFYEAYA